MLLMRFILFLAAVELSAGCSYTTKPWLTPGINLVGIRPARMTAEQQTLVISLNVNNRNGRALPIIGATYNLEVEGHEIANGASSLHKQIPAFDEGIVDVAVSTNLMDRVESFPDLSFTDGKWSYRISGVLQLADGYLPVPFNYSGEVEASQVMSRLML